MQKQTGQLKLFGMYALGGEGLTGRSAMISSKLWSMFDYGMVGNEAARKRRERLRRVYGLHQLFNAVVTSMKTEPRSLSIVLSVLMLLSVIIRSR